MEFFLEKLPGIIFTDRQLFQNARHGKFRICKIFDDPPLELQGIRVDIPCLKPGGQQLYQRLKQAFRGGADGLRIAVIIVVNQPENIFQTFEFIVLCRQGLFSVKALSVCGRNIDVLKFLSGLLFMKDPGRNAEDRSRRKKVRFIAYTVIAFS